MQCRFSNNTLPVPLDLQSRKKSIVSRCRCSTAASEHTASNTTSTSSSSQQEEQWQYTAPDHVLERNQQFVSNVLSSGRSAAGSKFILAPLTKGKWQQHRPRALTGTSAG